MILLTGATGTNWTEIARLLAGRGVPFHAMVRDPGRATDLAALSGATVVEGDFDDAESVARALGGAERVFLLTPSTERAEAQQLAFVEAAQRAGVRHLVKLSQYAASADSPVRFLRYHAAVEQAVRDSGMGYTFLRPNLFMQGLLHFTGTVARDGSFAAAAGDAAVSVVDVRDIARVAVAALTEPGHEGKTYTLTGPQALTHADMARAISEATGKPVRYVDVAPEAMGAAMVEMGMPPWQADGLVEDYAHYRRGEAASVETGVEEATGQPPGTFAAFARDYASAFSG